MVDDGALLDALEIGSLVLPPVPGAAEILDIPRVRVRATTIPNPFVNLAGMARFRDGEADALIRKVLREFARRRLPFGWMVGSRSAPGDLGDRLAAAGMTLRETYLALALRDLTHPIPVSSDVSVRRVSETDRALFSEMKSRSFGFPLEVAERIDEIVLGMLGDGISAHIALMDGRPVGFGQSFYVRDTGVVILGGSGVVPEARGKGAYRTLLARRLADATRDGMRAAVIQANAETSGPICLRLGFVDLGRLQFYVWQPPDPL